MGLFTYGVVGVIQKPQRIEVVSQAYYWEKIWNFGESGNARCWRGLLGEYVTVARKDVESIRGNQPQPGCLHLRTCLWKYEILLDQVGGSLKCCYEQHLVVNRCLFWPVKNLWVMHGSFIHTWLVKQEQVDLNCLSFFVSRRWQIGCKLNRGSTAERCCSVCCRLQGGALQDPKVRPQRQP